MLRPTKKAEVQTNSSELKTFEEKTSFTLDTVENILISCLDKKCEKLQKDGFQSLLTRTKVSQSGMTQVLF